MQNGTQNNEKTNFGEIYAKSTRFHGNHIFFLQKSLTKYRYTRNWPTLQILVQTDTALLRRRVRYISQHAEIAFQSLETLNMQIIC